MPLEELRAENDFIKYVTLLKQFAQRYCVAIAVKDTAVGPATTREVTGALMQLGLKEDLYGKFRCAYAALIDAGVLIYEDLKLDRMESADQTLSVGGSKIRLVSTGFQAADRKGLIQIDGKEHSLNGRGINIVVYDKESKAVLETASFDTYADAIPRFRPDADALALEAFVNRHPGVLTACVRLPEFPSVPVSPGEKFIKQNSVTFDVILQNLNQHIFALNQYFDEEGVASVLAVPKSFLDLHGVRRFEDSYGKYVNISGGHRETAYQPDKSQRTLYLVGGCTVFGVGSDDSRTIASFLQLLCRKQPEGTGIVVQNYGYFLAGMETTGSEGAEILNRLPVKPGDIVLYAIPLSSVSGELPCIDLSKAAEKPHSFEIFFDMGHFTPDGNRLIAEGLLRGLSDLGFLHSENRPACPPVEELRHEHDFLRYLNLLKQFQKQYCILVSATDTPCGPKFSTEISKLYREAGFQADLAGKFRCAYAAAIDDGKLVYEELCEEQSQYIDVTLSSETEDFQARIISKGYYTLQAGDKIFIDVNGTNYPSGFRGLNFVVYDKSARKAVDVVTFDTFSDSFPCSRTQEQLENWDEYRKAHPGVTVMGFTFPDFPPDKYLTPRERFTKEHHVSFGTILNNLEKHIFTLNQYFDEAGISEVLKVPKSYHDRNGVRHFEDTHGKYVNTAGGHRITAYQPERTANKNYRHIYLLGGCTTFGVGTDDSRTIASYLQAMFNEGAPDYHVIVENYGFYLAETDIQGDERLKILKSLPVKPGDIVLCDECHGFPMIDASQAAMTHRDFDAFIDKGHSTPGGYRLVAETIFKELLKLGVLDKQCAPSSAEVQPGQGAYGFDETANTELVEYKKSLTNWYDKTFNVEIGSVVMNCNPFTLGHRYLIEKALEQCGYLVIFVVQENKSAFSFEDRLRLVREGTADLNRVVVIPSGKFVLSSLTFSEYFNKAEMQDRTIDTSLDVLVFAQEIAPCLHIKKRFAGEEPFDSVTRQYNETMRRILPEYGIEFVEIPRRVDSGGNAISASRVRRLLAERNFEAVRPLVPETTFCYLTGGLTK